MSYVYNHNTGSVNMLPELAAKAFVSAGGALGWHGPFDTKDDVQKFYEANKKDGWKAPTDFLGVIGNAVPDIPDKIDPLGFGNLNFQHWLIRLAEIGIGAVLLAVGVSHLLGNGKGTLGKIGKAVRK